MAEAMVRTNNGLKYLVVLKDQKGRCTVVRIKAYTEGDAHMIAQERWPRHSIQKVKRCIMF